MPPPSQFIERTAWDKDRAAAGDTLRKDEFHPATAHLRERPWRDRKPDIPPSWELRPAGDDVPLSEKAEYIGVPADEQTSPAWKDSADRIRTERRKARRRPAGAPVHLHLQDGRVGETFVLELSEFGCRLFQTGPVLERFSKLGLWFGEIGPIHGHVCWSVGGVSGVEFSTPLNPVIVDRLTRS